MSKSSNPLQLKITEFLKITKNKVRKTDDSAQKTSLVVSPFSTDPGNSLSKEETNFLRYYLLCSTIATKSVGLYFTRKVPESALASHLNSHIRALTFSYWKCTSDQLAVLFPAKTGNVRSSEFDFSLLYKLIRNTITPQSTPTRGWGSHPLPGDITEEDDIERIRHNRNLLAHNTELKLNDSDFKNLWTDLSEAITRLSYGALLEDVNNLSKRNLDKHSNCEILNNLQSDLNKIKGEIYILHQDMNEIKCARKQFERRISNIEDQHIPPNVRRIHLELLYLWKKDDELFYDETNAYKATKNIVQSFSVVGLVGGPGCGKTATARHIALKYGEKEWEVVPAFKVEDILHYADVERKQIFLIDDIFGIFAIDMSMYNNVNNLREGIITAMSKDSVLLFTCRKSVFKEAVKLKSFVLENVLDLESTDNTLSEDEKEKILTNHCSHKGISKNIYCDIPLGSSIMMFPLLCKIFSTKHGMHCSVKRFFSNPFECLVNELDQLESISPHQYSALVLCVISNNNLSMKHMPIDGRKQDAFNTCGVNIGTSDKEIENALSYLVGTYLVQNESNFAFIHDIIYEIVAYHYGNKNPLVILKYMNSNFISTKVSIRRENSVDLITDLSIVIGEDHYENMAERLYTDLQSLELFDVFKNVSLSYPPFMEIFWRILRNKPYKDLCALFFLQVNAPNIMSRFYDKDVKMQDKYEEQRRQKLLLDIVFGMNANCSYPIRVISWIIYYGHTCLLQSLVDLVLEQNDSTDRIFGSGIIEQTRLLTLGCYSGSRDMARLILKYVSADCVNKTSLKESVFEYVKIFSEHRTYTPLTAACDSGHFSVVQFLLTNNANIDTCDGYHRFPLLTASKKGHLDIVKYLLQKGANVHQFDKHNQSPLYWASYGGQYDVVKYLVDNGANVNQCDINGKSPLYWASHRGHCDVVKYLLLKGAQVNQCDENGMSPLYRASEGGHYDVVKHLVLNGAIVNQCNRNDKSPLSIASEGGHCDVANYLLEQGGNVDNYSKATEILYSRHQQ